MGGKKKPKMTGLGTEATGEVEKRMLAVLLSQDEFNERAMSLAKLEEELASVEAEKKRVADDFKDRIGGLEHRRSELARVVRSQQEMREVECAWYADWAGKSMILRRRDNGEAVSARTMTPEEMQTGFGFQQSPAPKNRQLPPHRDKSDWDDDGNPPPSGPS